jgi:hypothetical protein
VITPKNNSHRGRLSGRPFAYPPGVYAFGLLAAWFMRGSDKFWKSSLGGVQQGTIPMMKSLFVAAALTIGLAGYAVAQDTVTGAPAGTAPMTPAPGTHPPIPGMTGSHKSQMRHRSNMSRERARASAHHMHHMRAKAAATPAT